MVDYSEIKGIVFDVDGVLSPSTIPLHPSGEPMRMVNIKDGYAIQLAVKHDFPLAIISGADVNAIRVRFEALGMTDIYMGSSMKLPVLKKWLEKYNLHASEVAFVGDDIPDLPAMHAVGVGAAPADACIEVIEAAQLVIPVNGGYGVARYIIEQVMKARGVWLDDKHAFGW